MTKKPEENFVCDNHPFKVGEYYCQKHDQMLCINCAWVIIQINIIKVKFKKFYKNKYQETY